MSRQRAHQKPMIPKAAPAKPVVTGTPASYTLTRREQLVARLGELGLLLNQLAAQHRQLSAERDQIIATLAQPEPPPEAPAGKTQTK